MDITPRISSDSKVIQSYNKGQFKVSDQTYPGSVIVTAEKVIDWSNVQSVDVLQPEDFEDVIKLKNGEGFEVLLIGTGRDFKFLDPEIKTYLQDQGLSPELMNTGAACRTFNVLLSEGRRVCALLCSL